MVHVEPACQAQQPVVQVVGLGDPVMDILAHVDHATLASITTGEPGGCFQLQPDQMSQLLEAAAACSTLKRIPGGSAANVMKGLANISKGSVHCKFLGMIGKDLTGQEYRTKLAEQGVDPVLLESDSGAPSARAVCLVTPDGQRTMRTCLGASLELQKGSQLPSSWGHGLKLLHCEGYCLYRPTLTKELTLAAKEKEALVSIDLASFELVRKCKDGFLDLLHSGCIDLLFANEEEVVTLAVELGLAPAEASHADKIVATQDFLLKHIQVSVVSMGPLGCQARSRSGEKGCSGAANVKVVDTIGAGDCFTAGFLFAFLQGADLQRSSEVGCAAGAQAVQAEGAELTEEAWEGLRTRAAALLSQQTLLQ